MVKQRQPGTNQRGIGSDLGLWHELVLAVRLYRDPRVSTLLKSVIPVLAALYVISPVDLIPDFLIGPGQVDDLGLLGLAFVAGLKLIRRWAPSEIVAAHLDEMGLDAPASPPRTSGPESDTVIETTYTIGNRSNRQTVADRGRRMA